MTPEKTKETFTKIVQANGVVTIPHELRKVHNIQVGDFVTLAFVKVNKGSEKGEG